MKRPLHAWRLCADPLAERGVPVDDMEDKERFKPRLDDGVLLTFVFSSHAVDFAAAAAFFLSQRVGLEETAGMEKLMADSNCTCDSIVEGFIVL